ncbi:MAG: nuclear transport factor 2 family protein [Myxococcota bacterium]|jgi:limonene-1,2-epoxide hydrolase|nr:nuclear transport factor 2 family protein [Myxococcota bacterium]
MSANAALVRDLIDAFNANDVDRVLGFFAADAVYHNMPVQPVTGTAAIRAVLVGFMGMASEIDWVLRNLAETQEGVVLTERLDRFLVRGRWIELPVMGAFEVRDGRITAWRDYFDMKQFQDQLAP